MANVTLVGTVPSSFLAASATSIAVARTGIVAGNLIVVAVEQDSTSGVTISNVSDGTTTVTTADVTINNATLAQRVALYSFPNHTGGTFTFTANFSATTGSRGIVVIELQNAALAPLEGIASATGNSTAPASGNVSPAPTLDGSYIIGFAAATGALTATGGFADLANDSTVTLADVDGLAQSAHAAVGATWTVATGQWGAIAACYKPAPSNLLVGTAGTRKAPGMRGPFDARGFLAARVWDYTIQAAAANINVLSDVGSLVLTGAVPVLDSGLATDVGALVLTGAAPVLGSGIKTDVGSLVLTGFSPVVGSGIATNTGSLVLTGFASKLTLGLATDVGSLVLTGFAPLVSVGVKVATDVGSLVLTGFAPTITVSANVTVATGVGSLVLGGLAPSLGLGIATNTGALVLSGLAPTPNIGVNVATDVGALDLTGASPSIGVTANVTVLSGAGALTLSGFAPTIGVSNHITVATATGALVLTGAAPTVTVGGSSVDLATDTGSLILTGYEPTVTATGQVVLVAPPTMGLSPAGYIGPHRGKRALVTTRDLLRVERAALKRRRKKEREEELAREAAAAKAAKAYRLGLVSPATPAPPPPEEPKPAVLAEATPPITIQPRGLHKPDLIEWPTYDKAELIEPEPRPEPHWLTDDDLDALIYALAEDL